MTDVFEVRNVTFGYTMPVISDMNIVVSGGEFTGIIGPNGAGKSTLLRLLAGEVKPWSGDIRFLGKNLKTYTSRDRARRRSVVRQDYPFLPAFTVREYVRMGFFPHEGFWFAPARRFDREVENILHETDIVHLAERTLDRLSTGELQRAHIARAVAQSGDILLLDEPVSHLDMHQAHRIMDLLHRLNARGATVIAILHDINLASSWCSRIIGIKNGMEVLDGPPDSVVKRDALRELFEIECEVIKNPSSGKPAVFPV